MRPHGSQSYGVDIVLIIIGHGPTSKQVRYAAWEAAGRGATQTDLQLWRTPGSYLSAGAQCPEPDGQHYRSDLT